MEKKIKVTVNKNIQFNLNLETAKYLDLENQKKNNYHILHDHRSFHAEILQKEFDKKEYTILVNSNPYRVKISNSLDQLIEDMGFSNGSLKQINHVKAPMPGIILAVNVKEGDVVKQGDTLIILEAMKMENAIICQRNGKIKKLHINKDDAIEKDKILIEFE